MVLIDPAYELRDNEFSGAERARREGYRRWATGTFAI